MKCLAVLVISLDKLWKNVQLLFNNSFWQNRASPVCWWWWWCAVSAAPLILPAAPLSPAWLPELDPSSIAVLCVACFGRALLKDMLVMALLAVLILSEGSWLRSRKSHTCKLPAAVARNSSPGRLGLQAAADAGRNDINHFVCAVQ